MSDGHLHPAAEARKRRKPFLMPVEDVFSHLRPRDGGDRPHRKRGIKVNDEVEIVGLKDDEDDAVRAWRCSDA